MSGLLVRTPALTDRRRLTRSRPVSALAGNAQPRCEFLPTEENVDSLTKREQPDGSKINMHQVDEVRYWTYAFGGFQRGASEGLR
jgi:hypothetical protein